MNEISFKELNLIDPIQRAIEAEKYTIPTPIQAAAIPHLLAGRDLLGCAQTGTGKTAAFALPILQLIDQNRQPATPRAVRVLVLSPTRELANQIGRSFEVYGRHLHFRQAVVFGGVNQNPQVRALARGVHVLVATPGRLLDLMGQGHVRLDALTIFVLDEADRMLDMGFLPDLRKIMARLPARRQSLFFSATMPSKVGELASALLADPVRINVTPPASTVERIEQRVYFVERSKKQALLHRLLGSGGVSRAPGIYSDETRGRQGRKAARSRRTCGRRNSRQQVAERAGTDSGAISPWLCADPRGDRSGGSRDRR